MEIKILEKGLGYAPIQNKIYEPECRRDFEDFARRVRVNWYFRNEPTYSFIHLVNAHLSHLSLHGNHL